MDLLRQALRRLARSVYVITAQLDGVRYAMTATAVTELSLEQPAMLVCINQTASMHVPLNAGASFAVNVLGCTHGEVAARCGGKAYGQDRFDMAEWSNTADGVPILDGALASIICTAADQLMFGTHTAFVGRVVDVRLAEASPPLVYFNGQFLSAAPLGLSAHG